MKTPKLDHETAGHVSQAASSQAVRGSASMRGKRQGRRTDLQTLRAARTPCTPGFRNSPPPCTKQASEPSPAPGGSWEQRSARRNCAERPRTGKRITSLSLELFLWGSLPPFADGLVAQPALPFLGGRPFAQPVGALPFVSGVGRPGQPPLWMVCLVLFGVVARARRPRARRGDANLVRYPAFSVETLHSPDRRSVGWAVYCLVQDAAR